MEIPAAPSIVLVGHAGSGKTSLCRALIAGAGHSRLQFSELPAASMLTPNTEAERVVYDTLLGRGVATPDGVVVVVDVQNLQAQLYLVSQVVDLRLPVVVALTMGDRAARTGLQVAHEQLAGLLEIPVVPVHPERGDGVDALRRTIEETLADAKKDLRRIHWRPSMGLADAYNHLDQTWIYRHLHLHPGARLIEGLRLLSSPKAVEEYTEHPAHGALVRTLEEARSKLESRQENWTLSEVLQRHNWSAQVAGQVRKTVVPEGWLDRMRLRVQQAPRWAGWVMIGTATMILALVVYYALGR